MDQVTQDTLRQLFAKNRNEPMSAAGLPADIMKAINQATGIVWYDLEPYAKLLFPVITPLRNEIPRVPGDGGPATHWVSITGININNVDIALGEGQRGGSVTTNVTQNLATYKSFGLDDSVTFEADLAAKNLDDVKQLAVDNLLRATMIGEEKRIIGGNSGALGTTLGLTPTPTLADVSAATGGGINFNTQVSVICVALTFDGLNAVGGPNAAPTANVVPGLVTRTNTDGSTLTFGGGSAQKSANATVTTANDSNTHHGVQASVAPVNAALGYAWFWQIGGTGSEKLGAITSINSVFILGAATGAQLASTLPGSDNSVNVYAFDGLLSQIFAPGSNSTIITQPTGTPGTGTPLTSNSSGGIVEIDNALKAFWDNFRLSPQVMLVNSQELLNITNKVIAGGGVPLFRFNMDSNSNQSLQATAGTVVGTYLNKYTMAGGQLVKVLLHPNVQPGTIIFYSRELPYPLSNVKNLLQMKMRRDYYQIEWPQVRPAYEYSVWANGVLQNFFPPAFGAITNIANG